MSPPFDPGSIVIAPRTEILCDHCGKSVGWSNAPNSKDDRPPGLLVICPSCIQRGDLQEFPGV